MRFTVGSLRSFYALLPMLFAVSAGRLVDRGSAAIRIVNP
jgi:hypothetical protein